MLDRELVEAVKLAREAGRILLEVYATNFGVEMKGESDPVTEADRRVNAFLSARIREAFPTDVIVAEESAADVRRLPVDIGRNDVRLGLINTDALWRARVPNRCEHSQQLDGAGAAEFGVASAPRLGRARGPITGAVTSHAGED